MRHRAAEQLHTIFGMEQLRPGQHQAVDALLRGRDVLCIMPTGAGKSLCFQLPAVALPGCALVVSPLIALMQDQVRGLRARGIPAACLNSLQSWQEQQAVLTQYQAGALKLLYVSPERLTVPSFRQQVLRHPPSLLVVDEAHCVVRWGKTFRPAYRHIGTLVRQLPRRCPICAFTATADVPMQRQLVRDLSMRRPLRVTLPLIRANLVMQCVVTTQKQAWLLDFLRGHDGEKGIVFCRTRWRTEQLAAFLTQTTGRCAAYHAGMSREAREHIQCALMQGETRLLCATSAFGMGVDVPDVRFVVLDALPESLPDLVQQFGRAGRDGGRADCVLLMDPADLERERRAMVSARMEARGVQGWALCRRKRHEKQALLRWGLCGECQTVAIAHTFGQEAARCGTCSACLRRARYAGRALAPVPPLHRMDDWELRLWAVRQERDAIARERGVRPKQVMPDDQLLNAARAGSLMEACVDLDVRQRIQRVLRHMMNGAYRMDA